MAKETFRVNERVCWTTVTGEGSGIRRVIRKTGRVLSVENGMAFIRCERMYVSIRLTDFRKSILRSKDWQVSVSLKDLQKANQPPLSLEVLEALRKRE